MSCFRYNACVCVLSCVWLFVTLWTVARQSPLSTGFSRQEYKQTHNMWVQPTVNRDSVLCWRSNHYPALLLSRFPLWSVKIFRIIHIILPIAFFYKGSANLRECEGKCSSWFLFTLKTIFLQKIRYMKDLSWFFLFTSSYHV